MVMKGDVPESVILDAQHRIGDLIAEAQAKLREVRTHEKDLVSLRSNYAYAAQKVKDYIKFLVDNEDHDTVGQKEDRRAELEARFNNAIEAEG